MSKARRGGYTLKTAKIGRVNCLRQQILMPGETMDISINGSIRLESLRERDVLRINAHIATFMTPLRWLWPEYTQYIKEGPDTLIVPPRVALRYPAALGIGSNDFLSGPLLAQYFVDSYLRVYNEWYKWPEDADSVSADMENNPDGLKAVPLQSVWSRCRYSTEPADTADYTVGSATDFDVRELAQIQGRFKSAMKRDVFSFDRWMELVKEMWKGDGSREVDQVPIMLDQQEIGVNPREIPATDGASLGQWQSLFDFNVDHQIKGVTAPEHVILTHMLVIRFPSTIEGIMPLARNENLTYWDVIAEPEYLASAKPVELNTLDILPLTPPAALGYVPAGWQWKCEHDVIGHRIDARNSFPYMLAPTNQAQCKDATRVKNAFRSQSLGDYMCDLYFSETGRQPIGDAMDSYMSGMMDDLQVSTGGRGQEMPKGGKQL